MKKIALMCAGQGAQYFQMGRELYAESAIFRDWMDTMDGAARELIGGSILDVIYDPKKNKSDQFDDTVKTSCAIYGVAYATSRMLMENGLQPDLVVGASLGELVAMAIAGVIEYRDGLFLAVKQAQVMTAECSPGGMLAIIDDIGRYYKAPWLNENGELAGIISPGHYVVSGKKSRLSTIEKYLNLHGVACQRLPVRLAFHSSEMEPSMASLKNLGRQISFRSPKIPVFSSCVGGRLDRVSHSLPWEIVRNPMRIKEVIASLPKDALTHYIDIGPSASFGSFIRQTLPSCLEPRVYEILTPMGRETQKWRRVQRQLVPNIIEHRNKDSKMKVAYVFSGQGSQKVGMGRDLFDVYKRETELASDILGYCIKSLCLEDPEDRLSQTQYTQPALYVVNALMWLDACRKMRASPAFLAGHSLGEYNALQASGALTFENGLRLVKARGELMGQARAGAMAAVIGLSADTVKELLSRSRLSEVYLANDNSPIQTVLSGAHQQIEQAQALFEKVDGVRQVIRLKVGGAFHSPLMQPARDAFARHIQGTEFNHFSIPVVANLDAKPYDPTTAKQTLLEQISCPVRWRDTIIFLLNQGVQEFVEIGTGKILTGLIQQTRSVRPSGENPSAAGLNKKSVGPFTNAAKGKMLRTTPQTGNDKDTEAAARLSKDMPFISAESLGCNAFKQTYGLKYAYLAGGMYRGISSTQMVTQMARAGMMSFLGAGGLGLDRIESDIASIKDQLGDVDRVGINLLHHPNDPAKEDAIVDLLIRYGIHVVEASAFIQMTPALVRYRLVGLESDGNGQVAARNKVIAKLSRPEVAQQFLSPPPRNVVDALLQDERITPQQADWAGQVPMADDICVEADSGGHTDQQSAYALLPAVINLRDRLANANGDRPRIRVGAAGGIGTPEAAAAAFVLGADFILTGSINQCTVEAGTSDLVKDLLQNANVQDTAYAPAGDMFEIGARVQVLKKGLFFPARANRLYEIYLHHSSLAQIDSKLQTQLQDKYFQKSFDAVWRDVRQLYNHRPDILEGAESNSKQKMGLTFRWYFNLATELALAGTAERRVDFQVHCGPALGAFNQWVMKTPLQEWRHRHVDRLGLRIMQGAADILNSRYRILAAA